LADFPPWLYQIFFPAQRGKFEKKKNKAKGNKRKKKKKKETMVQIPLS